MKNFSIIDNRTGQEYWISRSVAVVTFVFGYDKDNNEYILVEQRGKGTPDPEFVNKWCLPCGYVDFDETIEEAATREVYEETGVEINPNDWDLISVNSNPNSDKRQNITFRLCSYIRGIEDIVLSFENSELDEVSKIKWISTKEINSYEWAFNHKELINNYLK